ncbi:MAG: hypothetical protein ACKORL_01890, partial [Phycisphaerales bacterium]
MLPFALTAAFVAAVPALAQDGGDAPAAGVERSGLTEAASNFVHNVLIARPEQAQAAANVLLADDVDPSDLADAVDAGDLAKRMEDAFRRSRRMPEVSDAAAALETKLEAGRHALSRRRAGTAYSPAAIRRSRAIICPRIGPVSILTDASIRSILRESAWRPASSFVSSAAAASDTSGMRRLRR